MWPKLDQNWTDAAVQYLFDFSSVMTSYRSSTEHNRYMCHIVKVLSLMVWRHYPRLDIMIGNWQGEAHKYVINNSELNKHKYQSWEGAMPLLCESTLYIYIFHIIAQLALSENWTKN